jgi:hypothetical protein
LVTPVFAGVTAVDGLPVEVICRESVHVARRLFMATLDLNDPGHAASTGNVLSQPNAAAPDTPHAGTTS